MPATVRQAFFLGGGPSGLDGRIAGALSVGTADGLGMVTGMPNAGTVDELGDMVAVAGTDKSTNADRAATMAVSSPNA